MNVRRRHSYDRDSGRCPADQSVDGRVRAFGSRGDTLRHVLAARTLEQEGRAYGDPRDRCARSGGAGHISAPSRGQRRQADRAGLGAGQSRASVLFSETIDDSTESKKLIWRDYGTT